MIVYNGTPLLRPSNTGNIFLQLMARQTLHWKRLFVTRITTDLRAPQIFYLEESRRRFYFLKQQNSMCAEEVIRITKHRNLQRNICCEDKLQENVSRITWPNGHPLIAKAHSFFNTDVKRYSE